MHKRISRDRFKIPYNSLQTPELSCNMFYLYIRVFFPLAFSHELKYCFREYFFLIFSRMVNNYIYIYKYIFFFSVRLLSVLRGHSFFSSPPQRSMTSDFEGFSIQDFIHYIYFPILILEQNGQYFPF